MRPMHPPRPSTLLAALVLAAGIAAPLSAQVPRVCAAAPAPGAAVSMQDFHLESLQARLQRFAAGLGAEERALWDKVLLRAATAPAAGSEVRVLPVLQIGPGGGCDEGPGLDEAANRAAIIVEGGRSGIIVEGGRSGIIVQGGRTAGAPAGVVQGADAPRPNPTSTVSIGPKQDDPSRPGRAGAVAIGPKQDDPGAPRPGSAVSIGPKQDDPGAPRPGSAVSIGPKQDDPGAPPQSLGRRLAEFSTQLPAEERAALDWLLTRAAQAPEGRHGTPGGLASTPAPEDRPGRPGGLRPGAVPAGRPGTPGGIAPGRSVSLRQALGIDALAIGPKQDDPTPPRPARGWVVRY
ncbi:MAG: hypothetical protein KY467_18875 [Gemmatimonadetes bacterium]|nr:hypothetical protein [Gemmatimonadota bacterium]